MKEETLRSLGLNNKEVKLYLTNLRLGSSRVNEIANIAGINRTSTYDVLKSLELKGFVSYIIKNGKRFYQSTKPEDIISLLKEKELMVQKIIPELNLISESISNRPNIEVYSGIDGIKTIFEMILREADSFYTLASTKHLKKLFKFYFPNWVKRVMHLGNKRKLIVDAIPLDKKAPYKIINKKIKTGMWLFNGKIAMISLEEKEPIGIIIDEKNFYQTQKMLFEMLWENLD